MKKYIPYLLKFAFMIFAIFPAIKHEWLAISVGVIALAIPLVCFVWCWISDSVMKAFEHTREDSIYNVMISLKDLSYTIPFMIACCCGPLFWRFNYSTSIMNILLRKTTSNNSIFTNGES